MSVNPCVSVVNEGQCLLEKENLPAKMRKFLREPPASGSYADSRVLCKKLVDMREVSACKSMSDLFALKIRELGENKPEQLIALIGEMADLVEDFLLGDKLDRKGDLRMLYHASEDESDLYKKLCFINAINKFKMENKISVTESFYLHNININKVFPTPLSFEKFLELNVYVDPGLQYWEGVRSAVSEYIHHPFRAGAIDLSPEKIVFTEEEVALFRFLASIKSRIIFD